MDAPGTEAAAKERFANSTSLHPRPLTSAALDCQKLDDLGMWLRCKYLLDGSQQ